MAHSLHSYLLAIQLILLYGGAVSHLVQAEPRPGMPFDSTAVRTALTPLDLSSTQPDTPELRSYYRHYGLDHDIPHYFGTIESDSFTIVGHVFLPDSAKATVIAAHGYYDHSGVLWSIIAALIGNDYAVVTLDLPGHGLSSGPRASIDNFTQYGNAVHNLVTTVTPGVASPLFFIGHSTGCAAGIEYMHRYPDHPIAKAVFLAPLVKSAYFKLSKLGFAVLDPLSKTYPRWKRHSTHDRRLQRFLLDDPLTHDRFPTQWSRSYFSWFERVQSYDPITTPLLIVQGDQDDVVDWKYNLPFLEKKFTTCSTRIISGARHHLPNETKAFRSQVIHQIITFF